jgi:hypothetical protein
MKGDCTDVLYWGRLLLHRQAVLPVLVLFPAKSHQQHRSVLWQDRSVLPPRTIASDPTIPNLVLVDPRLCRLSLTSPTGTIVIGLAGSSAWDAYTSSSHHSRHHYTLILTALGMEICPPVPSCVADICSPTALPVIHPYHHRSLSVYRWRATVYPNPQTIILLYSPRPYHSLCLPQRLSWSSPSGGYGGTS